MFYSPLEQFDSILIVKFFCLDKLDLSLTNIVFPSFLVLFFLIIFIAIFITKITLIPMPWQIMWEAVYIFIKDIIVQQAGYLGLVFFPFIFTMFFFILSNNLISLLPFGIALTSHFSVILFLSAGLGLSLTILGIYKHGVKFFQFFIPDCPFLLLFLLIILEIFSYILRFLSLSIRLCANIMAGHTLVHIVTTFLLNIFLLNNIAAKIIIFSMGSILLLAILSLEFGVAFLQAYVFTILVSIYFSDVLKEPSH